MPTALPMAMNRNASSTITCMGVLARASDRSSLPFWRRQRRNAGTTRNAIMMAMRPPAVRMMSRNPPRFKSTRMSEGRVAMSQHRRRFHFVCSSMMSDSAS